VVSLPALFNIGALLTLITFIYAILGMALFNRSPKNGEIDVLFNFDTFLNSSLMLFRYELLLYNVNNMRELRFSVYIRY